MGNDGVGLTFDLLLAGRAGGTRHWLVYHEERRRGRREIIGNNDMQGGVNCDIVSWVRWWRR